MKWYFLGTRKESLFDSSSWFPAMSKGLKRELGFGYSQIILNSTGEAYVPDTEHKKITKLIIQKPKNITYLKKMYLINKKLQQELNSIKIDFKKTLKLAVDFTTYFYIAKFLSEFVYLDPKTSEKDKKFIESWRNDQKLWSTIDLLEHKTFQYLKISKIDFDNLTLTEVLEMLKGRKILSIAKSLIDQNTWSLQLDRGKIKLHNKLANPAKVRKNSSQIVKGNSAYSVDHIIMGTVGVDILVMIMTSPNIVSEMRKMKAVITDEGGLLCHAAITAREFKIPTIIGTKIATQVLKDGDLVEVDGNKGIVRKLN